MALTAILRLPLSSTLDRIISIFFTSVLIMLLLQYLFFGEYYSCELRRDTQYLYYLYKPLLNLLDFTDAEF